MSAPENASWNPYVLVSYMRVLVEIAVTIASSPALWLPAFGCPTVHHLGHTQLQRLATTILLIISVTTTTLLLALLRFLLLVVRPHAGRNGDAGQLQRHLRTILRLELHVPHALAPLGVGELEQLARRHGPAVLVLEQIDHALHGGVEGQAGHEHLARIRIVQAAQLLGDLVPTAHRHLLGTIVDPMAWFACVLAGLAGVVVGDWLAA
mmetsp:Transcript_21659/g.60312  ORF Transcript_21659/g.60312 Transcript_21659/m.60312 type:complete len:208 (-) Transcript_21659:789-1412(-)